MLIEKKLKKCKGTGKAIDSGCLKETYSRHYGLCNSCYADWLLHTDNGKAKLERSKIISKKRIEKARRKKTREQKEADKSIQKLIQEARAPFHKWIRLRDANRECISCGSTDSKIWDAGHYFKAEIYSGLVFNEKNVHKQCGKCNRFLGGNERGYRAGLIKRFGEQYVLHLEANADFFRLYKHTREDIRVLKQMYLKRLKDAIG